jgi:hypothetical protein
METRELRRDRRYKNNETGVSSLHPLVSEWSQTVINNGGFTPTQKTQQSLNMFINDLVESELFNKMYSINCIVPDNLTASLTPLLRYNGFEIWQNNGFVESDLTVDGLKGNGTNKWIDTGIIPYGIITSNEPSLGMTIYTFGDKTELGLNYIDAYATSDGNFGIWQQTDNKKYFDGFDQNTSNGRMSSYGNSVHGYISANRGTLGSGVTQAMYWANPIVGHITAQSSSNSTLNAPPTGRIYLYVQNNDKTLSGPYSPKRYSFFAIHSSLTSQESYKFYNIIQKLRKSLGGGYIRDTAGEEWASRVVYYSGTQPSASTVSAMQTFYDGLIEKNLLNKIYSANLFAPENLTASLIPIVRKFGYEMWTNNGFTSSSISINGLKGNGSAYLKTGVLPSIIYNSNASGGFTIYNSSDNSQAATYNIGTSDGAGQQITLYLSNAGATDYWDCYDNTNGNGRIFGPTTASFLGYTSANTGLLTESIRRAIYIANSTNSHRTIVSGTTAASGIIPTGEVFVFTIGPGAPSPTTMRYSFVAIHDGLTPSESSDLYDLVQAARITIGGGYV